jgi:flagellar hook-associated protein 1 FlgK
MGVFGASFEIGRSALAAYQAAITVTGQNIANVGNPDYTRQSGRLAASRGIAGQVSPGTGVQLNELQRHFDVALEDRLHTALSEMNAAEVKHRHLNQIESMYNELTDADLSTQLSTLFGAFGTLQSTPEDAGQRSILLAAAEDVVRTMNRQRDGLIDQVEQMNTAAEAGVSQVNGILSELAKLNDTIVVQEANGLSVASGLRDRRDLLLRELSETMSINVTHFDNGSVSVYSGNETLVEYNRAAELRIERSFQDGIEIFEVRLSENNALIRIDGGVLDGVVNTRDNEIVDQIRQLDTLAKGLIYEVNRAHANGRGLDGLTHVVAQFDLLSSTVALNDPASGIPFPVQNGTFTVNVRDEASGLTTSRLIEVDLDGIGADTSLQDLAASLDAVDGISASVTSDNRLEITSDSGREFWFSEDSSGALAALGVNTFFNGTDAGSIEVSSILSSNVRMIAASANGELGNGDIAGNISRLADSNNSLLGGASIVEYQAGIVSSLAISTSAALTDFTAAETVHAGLVAQREAISGVSLDEEALNLTIYERSFQGASRFLSTIQDLTAELLNIAS